MKLNRAEVLSSKDIQMIDHATREVLKNTGILVLSDNVLKMLAEKGLNVDMDKKIVKFSEKIIDESLGSVPGEIKIYGREKDYFLELGKGEKTFAASGHNAI